MIKTYIGGQLAASGIAILDKSIAYSSGLWHSQTNCHMQFRDMEALIKQFGRGCEITVATLDGRDVAVLHKSDNMLAQRIQWLTGMVVSADRPYSSPVPVAPPVAVPTFAKEFDARYKKEMAAKAREDKKWTESAKHQEWLDERRAACRT
jgi:hypothetical protein